MPKRFHEDEDEIDDRPRRRKLGPPRRKPGPSPLLVAGLVVGGLLLLGGGTIAAVLLLRDRSVTTGPKEDPFPGMLAHWSFDDLGPVDEARATTVIRDGTGRGNDGLMTGARLAAGRKGNALWLDGRDDQYVDVSRAKDLSFAPNAELTIAAWFLAQEKFSGTIVAFRSPVLPTQLDIFSRDNRVIGIIVDDEDTGQHGFVWSKEPTAADGRWHHVALTRRGKVVELYYDGASQGTDLRGNSGGRLSGGFGAIGCNLSFVRDAEHRFGRAGYKGAIDEVYVFSRALRPEEITALMNR